MKMQLAILTRSFDFSSRQRFFLSFLFIFFSFFLSFLFIFFSLSLSFPRETVCQTVVCTEMTRTSDDKPTQEVSGPWQAFIYDPTSPLRTDEPVNRIYRWKWRSIAALCLESTIRAWEIIAPISHWIFFPPCFACPSTLSLFFFAFLLFRGIDRCTHQLQTLRSFVQGNDGREEEFSSWYKFLFFLISEFLLNNLESLFFYFSKKCTRFFSPHCCVTIFEISNSKIRENKFKSTRLNYSLIAI